MRRHGMRIKVKVYKGPPEITEDDRKLWLEMANVLKEISQVFGNIYDETYLEDAMRDFKSAMWREELR